MNVLLLLMMAAGWTRSAHADLDGDGKKERITVAGEGRWKLTVGGSNVRGKHVGDAPAAIKVVDLDRRDRTKEILLDLYEMGDNHTYKLFRYEKEKLVELGSFSGTFPSAPEVPGNGSLRTKPWLGFYQANDKLVLKDGKLARVPQAFFWVGGVKAKPKGVPTLWREPTLRGAKVGKLAPNKAFEIIGHRPKKAGSTSAQKGDLFLVRSSSGLVGWIRFEDVDVDSLPWAG